MRLETWCAYLISDICLQQYFLSIQTQFVLLNFNCVSMYTVFFSLPYFRFLPLLDQLNQPLNPNHWSVCCHSFNYKYLNVAYPRCARERIQQTAQKGPANDRRRGWQCCHDGMLGAILLWERWYALRHHIRRPSSLVIRALIAAARCKQRVILFVSRTVLFSNFVLLTSNWGIEGDLGRQAAVS